MVERLRAGCACGWEVIGTADEIVAATMDHAQRVHNMTATREHILAKAVAVPANLDPDASSESGATSDPGR